MNVFGVGLPEIAVISALALIIFGPKRLPELGRTIGKTLKGLQSASSEFEKEIQKAMNENEPIEGSSSKVDFSNNQNSKSQNSRDDKATNTLDN